MKRKGSLISHLERSVVSTNVVLKDKVKEMGVIELLCNVHPENRVGFAYLCRDAGLIHPSEVTQFLPTPNLKWKNR